MYEKLLLFYYNLILNLIHPHLILLRYLYSRAWHVADDVAGPSNSSQDGSSWSPDSEHTKQGRRRWHDETPHTIYNIQHTYTAGQAGSV